MANLPTANNEENWATMTLLAIARTMEMPADATLKDLPALAADIMSELHAFRTEQISRRQYLTGLGTGAGA